MSRLCYANVGHPHTSDNDTLENAQKIQECRHRYDVNFCATQYTPALVEQCATWGLCMSGNPGSINRAALFAGYLAKIMHSFCHNMSLQTMVHFITLGCFLPLLTWGSDLLSRFMSFFDSSLTQVACRRSARRSLVKVSSPAACQALLPFPCTIRHIIYLLSS